MVRFSFSTDDGFPCLFGETDNPQGLREAIEQYLLQSRDNPQPGLFRRVYTSADPKSDRELATLVAVYLHVYRDRDTTSVNVRKLAVRLNHSISNASTALADAVAKGDVKRLPGKDRPVRYRPTEAAIKRLARHIQKAKEQKGIA